MMSQLTGVKDIIWLAGLLEGEGCFMLKNEKYPRIVLGMTDEDIIVRAATLMKSRIYLSGNMYRVQVDGVKAVAWMMTLYTLLGKRRRESISKVIKIWKARSHYKRSFNRIQSMAKCHPDKEMHALDLCNSCYCRQSREKRLLEKRALWNLCKVDKNLTELSVR